MPTGLMVKILKILTPPPLLRFEFVTILRSGICICKSLSLAEIQRYWEKNLKSNWVPHDLSNPLFKSLTLITRKSCWLLLLMSKPEWTSLAQAGAGSSLKVRAGLAQLGLTTNSKYQPGSALVQKDLESELNSA